MNRQNLFQFDPPVRHDAPDTSREASEFIKPHVSRLAIMVLAHVRDNDGATCAEVEIATGLRHQTASARLTELKDARMVEDSGHRRKTPSGCKAIVWRIVPPTDQP